MIFPEICEEGGDPYPLINEKNRMAKKADITVKIKMPRIKSRIFADAVTVTSHRLIFSETPESLAVRPPELRPFQIFIGKWRGVRLHTIEEVDVVWRVFLEKTAY